MSINFDFHGKEQCYLQLQGWLRRISYTIVHQRCCLATCSGLSSPPVFFLFFFPFYHVSRCPSQNVCESWDFFGRFFPWGMLTSSCEGMNMHGSEDSLFSYLYCEILSRGLSFFCMPIASQVIECCVPLPSPWPSHPCVFWDSRKFSCSLSRKCSCSTLISYSFMAQYRRLRGGLA